MVSIIIPVFNQIEMTRECLESIRENTRPEYEVILIDNGSEPQISCNALQTKPWESIIHNDHNLGFPIAVNQGIGAAGGDVICILNNDVIVTPGWLEGLISRLSEFSIIGPVTNYAAGMQRAIVSIYENREELNKASFAWLYEHAGQTKEVKWITGFCFIFKRILIDEIGFFDESLWPCSGEEIDFCLRVRDRGHKIGIARDVYVHHHGSSTFKTMPDLNYDDIVTRNNQHLQKKWGAFVFDQNVPKEIPKMSNGLRLNLGCGRFKLPDFINIDQLERVNPDLICDVLNLPYEQGTVDEIYAGHILEHFAFADGLKALHYWHSLLKDGGIISISVPDYDVLVKDYIANSKAEKLQEFNDLFIYSYAQESPHKYMYNEQLLTKVMADTGFVDLQRMPIDHPYFPLPVRWQVGYQGRKGKI